MPRVLFLSDIAEKKTIRLKVFSFFNFSVKKVYKGEQYIVVFMKPVKVLLAVIFAFLIIMQSFSAVADVAYKDKQNDVVGSDGKSASDPDIDIKEISCAKTDTDFELTMVVYGSIVKDSESASYAFLLKMGDTWYIVKYTNNTCLLFKFSGASDKSSVSNISKYDVLDSNLMVTVPKTAIEDASFVFEAINSRGGNSDTAGPPASTTNKTPTINMALYGGIGAGIVIVIIIIVVLVRFKSKSTSKKLGLETKQQPPGALTPYPPQPPVPYQTQYPTQQPQQSQYGYAYPPPPTDQYANPQDMYAPYYAQESYTGQNYYPPAPGGGAGYGEPIPPQPYQPQPEQQQFARCHVCGGTIPIPSSQRPITIVCPACGTEGVID